MRGYCRRRGNDLFILFFIKGDWSKQKRVCRKKNPNRNKSLIVRKSRKLKREQIR